MKPMPVSLYRPALVNSAMDNGSYTSVLDSRWTLKSFLKIYEFQDWKHPRQKLCPSGIFLWLHSKTLCHGKHFFPNTIKCFCQTSSVPAHSMMPKELHELPIMFLISWLDGKNKQTFSLIFRLHYFWMAWTQGYFQKSFFLFQSCRERLSYNC